ncbi:MAG: alpha/beta hydrolase [Actinomycetota bacterium]|nr:alpha/beta hydrolase [Actinomycetota bacterium]
MTTTTDESVDLYWEAIGSGPAVLLIAGTPGDGGQFTGLAEELAGDHLVITYDRRGTSRSAPPAGWSETTVAEQAHDAAAVLARVGVPRALVYGTSNGAAVALELAIRHPGRVQRAIVHEMPLLSVLEDPAPVASAIGALIGAAMEAGGPEAALDAFLRFAFGDAIVDGWAPELRDRLLANAAMAFAVELPAFQAYRPDPEQLAACPVPVTVLVGEETQAPFFHEAARWVADRLGTTVESAPGAHGAHFSDPAALARALRDIEGDRER